MKKLLSILLTVSILSVSCSKSIDNPATITPTDNPKLGTSGASTPHIKKFMVNGREITLKMIMEPAVACYSYRNGETPRPCDIFVEFTCTLSEPVNGYVTVAVQKKTMMGTGDPQLTGLETGPALALTIAPNATKFVYRSSFTNNNNVTVPENNFSIENVAFYNKVD